ncbi:uncharacterized protein LOC142344777 isoform X4 [Convolutriloba macropyga]|uniref:uncharacterized protein LOC142344777 isoform X4 n=1 Tax=Convolutriloba macropyga TaxID=536237 RepID=UPI003F52820F
MFCGSSKSKKLNESYTKARTTSPPSSNYASKPSPNFAFSPSSAKTTTTTPNSSTSATPNNKKKRSSFLPNFRDKLSNDKSGNNQQGINNSKQNQSQPSFVSGNHRISGIQGLSTNESSSQSKTGSGNRNSVNVDANRQNKDPRIGDIVYFGELKGVIRYIGTTHFAPANAVYCGLELYTPSGKNDGAIEGVRYFQCPFKFGLFVAIERVSFKPTKEPLPSKVTKSPTQNIAIPILSRLNDDVQNEVRRKTSSLRDHTSYFGSSYVRNESSQVAEPESKSVHNVNVDRNSAYIPRPVNSLKASGKTAPKTPPSSTRKVFLTPQQQFLRTQSVPKLPTSDVSNHNQAVNNAISPIARDNPPISPFESNQGTSNLKPNGGNNETGNISKLERFLRPRNSKGNISKIGGGQNEGTGSQRNSLTEAQMLSMGQNMSDLTMLMRDKQMQSGIASTPLGDGSPGSALRQAQYLFTCPSPTPDQIFGDMGLEIATDTYVIESEDHYDQEVPMMPDNVQGQPLSPLGLNLNEVQGSAAESNTVPSQSLTNESTFSDNNNPGMFVNRLHSQEENNSDKLENFLETIPEAENSMANTLDRLADRHSINSDDSCCIPSKRTSPDGSCDNSIDVNYGNRKQFLAQPIIVKSPFANDQFAIGKLDEDVKGSRETISGDENEDENLDQHHDFGNRVMAEFERSKLRGANRNHDDDGDDFYNPSPELPRSLTSSCNILCEGDQEDVINSEYGEDGFTFDEGHLHLTPVGDHHHDEDRPITFSPQSQTSQEDDEDPYCVLKEGSKRPSNEYHSNSERSSPENDYGNNLRKASSSSSNQLISDKEYEIVQDDVYVNSQLNLNTSVNTLEHEQTTPIYLEPQISSEQYRKLSENLSTSNCHGMQTKPVFDSTKRPTSQETQNSILGPNYEQSELNSEHGITADMHGKVSNIDGGKELCYNNGKSNGGKIVEKEKDVVFHNAKQGTALDSKQYSQNFPAKASGISSITSNSVASNLQKSSALLLKSDASNKNSALKAPLSYNNAKSIKNPSNKTTGYQSSNVAVSSLSSVAAPVLAKGESQPPANQKFGYISKPQILNRELPPVPKLTQNQSPSHFEGEPKRSKVDQSLRENKPLSGHIQNQHEHKDLNNGLNLERNPDNYYVQSANEPYYCTANHPDKRFSELELPSPSLIFEPEKSSHENSSSERKSKGSEGRLNSNYHLSEDEKVSSTTKAESKDSSLDLQDTDDEILRHDPAIVRVPKKKFSLPTSSSDVNNKLISRLRAPSAAGSNLPFLRSQSATANHSTEKLSTNQSEVALVTNQSEAELLTNQCASTEFGESMVVGSSRGAQKPTVANNQSAHGLRKGSNAGSAGPPPLPARHPKLANQRPLPAVQTNRDQKPDTNKVKDVNNAQSAKMETKTSKLAQPRVLSSTSAHKSSADRPGSADAKKSEQTKKAMPRSGLAKEVAQKEKMPSGKGIQSPGVAIGAADVLPSVEKENYLSIFDVDSSSSVQCAQKSPSLSSLSSNKSTDRSAANAAPSAKNPNLANQNNRKPPSAQSKTSNSSNHVTSSANAPNVAASPSSNAANRKTSMPIVSGRLAAGPLPASPVMQRKKKGPAGQSKLATSGLQKQTGAKSTSNTSSKEESELERMQSEVSSLSAQLEQKCHLLEKSTLSLEASNKAVDVFSILIQHMAQSMGVFSVPELKCEIARLHETLEQSTEALDAANGQINQLRVHHEARVEQLGHEQRDRLSQLRSQMEMETDEQTEKLKQSHEEEKEFLVTEHELQLSQLKESHQSELEEVLANQEATIENIERKHRQTVESLNDQYTQDITSTQLVSSQTINKLREQISELEQKNSGLARKLMELERYIEQSGNLDEDQWKKGFFEPEADGRPRTKSVPDMEVGPELMPQELESLRCVLEMRDEEIHRLRREMNDANALRETLIQKEDELQSCRLQVESLQASLEMKGEMEKELRVQCNEQAFKLKQEKKQRKHLTADNERLTYQMRDMEIVVQGFLDREASGEGPEGEGGRTEHLRASSLPSSGVSGFANGRPASLSVNKMNQTFTGPIASTSPSSKENSNYHQTKSFSSPQDDTSTSITSPETECISHPKSKSHRTKSDSSSLKSSTDNSLDRSNPITSNVSSPSSCGSESNSQPRDSSKTKRQKSLAFTVPF